MLDSAPASDGLGTLGRAALRVFADHPSQPLDTLEVACSMFGKSEVSERELASTRRVLRILTKRGRLRDMSRHWPDARRRWTLHAPSNSVDSSDGGSIK
jgi:hypothetical protein